MKNDNMSVFNPLNKFYYCTIILNAKEWQNNQQTCYFPMPIKKLPKFFLDPTERNFEIVIVGNSTITIKCNTVPKERTYLRIFVE